MRRSVDHDQIHGTDPIVDPLRRAPARQCGKIKTDTLCPEPRTAQIDPSREAALRIDIKCCNPCAAACPGDGELSGEGCLSGAAFTLCDRDDQPHHATCALARLRRLAQRSAIFAGQVIERQGVRRARRPIIGCSAGPSLFSRQPMCR